MTIILTITMSPETPQESLEFNQHYQSAKTYFEQLQAQGTIPAGVEMRWLLKTKRFAPTSPSPMALPPQSPVVG